MGSTSGAETPAGEQRGGDALGVRFQRRGTIGGQGQLTGEELADALAQRRPIAGCDVEVSSQVEQGALSHLRAGALGAHEAEGEVLAVAAGAPDEHASTVAGCGVWARHEIYFTALHSPLRRHINHLQPKIGEIATIPHPIKAHGGKDGVAAREIGRIPGKGRCGRRTPFPGEATWRNGSSQTGAMEATRTSHTPAPASAATAAPFRA